MSRYRNILFLVVKTFLSASLFLVFTPAQAKRLMNVTLGPDTVFERQISEIIPELSGSTMTNENGRIGGEMVFWGHQLTNGSEAYLFACSVQDNVDCESRIKEICPATSGNLLNSVTESGLLVHRKCKSVAFAGTGDIRPGCSDDAHNNEMLVGLLQCS